MDVSIGSLAAVPALSRPDLLAAPVASALAALGEDAASEVGVAERTASEIKAQGG